MTKAVTSYLQNKLTPEMFIADVCFRTGWTYDMFLAQPDWLIELIAKKYEIDANEQKSQLKK